MENYEARQLLREQGCLVDIDDRRSYVEIVEFLKLAPETAEIVPVPAPDTL